MAKLTNFIENYLKNQKISDYEGWLALYGKDEEAPFREAKAAADTAYASTRAEHGARASSLYAKGLSGSGYGDYLNHAAYATRQNALTKALREKRAARAENERGYLSYLESALKQEEEQKQAKAKEEQKIFSDLLSQKLLDENSAVTYLKVRGIDEGRARELAKESLNIQKGSRSYVNQLINEAEASNMDYYTAYAYALAKGLDEESAHSAATVAAFRVADRKARYTSGYNYY